MRTVRYHYSLCCSLIVSHQSSTSNRLLGVLGELKTQIESRFTYDTVPDADGYVAIDLIASALDPRTKKLRWLPSDQREAVWKGVEEYALSLSPLSFQLNVFVFLLPLYPS